MDKCNQGKNQIRLEEATLLLLWLLWCTSEVGITRADLYRSGPLAGVACLCDEARDRVYKGGPLPLWTTHRHHIITKEKLSLPYLGVTYSCHS